MSAFDAALADARTALETARALVAGGTPVDLAGLDALVAAACDAANGDGRSHQAAQALADLGADLDALAAALAAQHAQVARDDATARRAAAAYAKPANP